ncbi:MAG: hypothetical protein OIN87_02355 [Candidatus Methanoperedens sp.]|nr:hypothetical protein [Candidatus Methanoperedens sp.]
MIPKTYFFFCSLLFIGVLISGCTEKTQNETIINDSVVPEYSPAVDLAIKE